VVFESPGRLCPVSLRSARSFEGVRLRVPNEALVELERAEPRKVRRRHDGVDAALGEGVSCPRSS
jgi:hypothetical protein